MTSRNVAKLAVVLGVVLMALLAPVAASVAQAQEPEPQLDYPGPIREVPTEIDAADLGPSFVPADIRPGDFPADTTGDTTTVGGTGGGDSALAATGSDVEPILAISIGLLAVGGSALVTSRRRLGDGAS